MLHLSLVSHSYYINEMDIDGLQSIFKHYVLRSDTSNNDAIKASKLMKKSSLFIRVRCLIIGIILLTVNRKYDTIRKEGNTSYNDSEVKGIHRVKSA